MDISHNRVGGLVQLLQYGEVKLSGRLNVREVDRLMKVSGNFGKRPIMETQTFGNMTPDF
jgi:hypothetical protein